MKFPQITTWIRAKKEDFQIGKATGNQRNRYSRFLQRLSHFQKDEHDAGDRR